MFGIRTAAEAYDKLAAELEVPESKYEDAERCYRAVGDWLGASDSPLYSYRPRIYVQGSFALGTAIKPLADGDYDVDAVCLLENPPSDITQQQLKRLVGERLRAHGKYETMLDPRQGGRRCWTIKYADSSKFHLDVLPAVPDQDQVGFGRVPSEWLHHAIKITDRETWSDPTIDWPKSNPKGYLAWFRQRQAVRLDEAQRRMAKSLNVERVPDDKVRTPLHRVIQLLKRNRDERFGDDPDRPISIIITTLAAQCYENESDLSVAMSTLVPKMRAAIEDRNGVAWIPNPLQPEENFADKWAESPRKQELFLRWLSDIEQMHGTLVESASRGDEAEMRKSLNEAFGERHVTAALAGHESRQLPALLVAPGKSERRQLLAVPHRQPLRWELDVSCQVKIRCTANSNGFRQRSLRSDEHVPPRTDLNFVATTNASGPFEVYWQVVNTGPQARGLGQLRGGFEPGQLTHYEEARYIGMHWIQCFLVHNGKCVGKSDEFIVDIRI